MIPVLTRKQAIAANILFQSVYGDPRNPYPLPLGDLEKDSALRNAIEQHKTEFLELGFIKDNGTVIQVFPEVIKEAIQEFNQTVPEKWTIMTRGLEESVTKGE